MNEKTLEGLKAWGRQRRTATISEHLAGHDIDDPTALAVWIRKQALGEEEFARHQAEGRAKRKKG
jgi:hypothetical protein